MNSGPSATFGIMFSVTNKGSNNRLTSGAQKNATASATPTSAPSAKPPRISTAVTARLESHAYFADVSVATVANGDGSTDLGTWKASTVHDQDDRKRPDRAHSVTGHHVLLVGALLASCLIAKRRGPGSLSRIVPSFNQLVDYCSGSSLRANGSRD